MKMTQKTILTQESITISVTIPVAVFFIIKFFNFPQLNIPLFLIFVGIAIVATSITPHILKGVQRSRVDTLLESHSVEALSKLLRWMPLSSSLLSMFRWSIMAQIAIAPFIFNGTISGVEHIGFTLICVVTGVTSMGIYYMIEEKNLREEYSTFFEKCSKPVFVFSLKKKIILSVGFLLAYPIGMLITIALLLNAKLMPIESVAFATFSVAVVTILVGIISIYFVIKSLDFSMRELGSKSNNLTYYMSTGDFSSKISSANLDHEFITVTDSFLQLQNAISGPIMIMQEYIESLSNGIIQKNIENSYEGSFNELIEKINNLSSGLVVISKNITDTISSIEEGDLSIELRSSGLKGFWSDLNGGIKTIMEDVTKPIQAASLVLKQYANNDISQRMEGEYKGEFAQLKNSVDVLQNNLIKTVSYLKNSSSSLSDISQSATHSIQSLVAVATETAEGTNTILVTTEEMNANINSIASSIEEISINSSSVSSGAEELSVNMRSVTNSIEKLQHSVQEISEKAQDADEVAKQAVEQSKGTSDTMNQLGVAATEIGKVMIVIKRISEQTNLLALNATIEAASAGEAGKGFAVVANEIKDLARQSATAAEDISKRVSHIQQSSDDAVSAISSIMKIILGMGESISEISSAVIEQSEATEQISNSVSEASIGTTEIAKNIGEISGVISDVSSSVGETSIAIAEINQNLSSLTLASNNSAKEVSNVAHIINQVNEEGAQISSMINVFKLNKDI